VLYRLDEFCFLAHLMGYLKVNPFLPSKFLGRSWFVGMQLEAQFSKPRVLIEAS